MTAARRLVSTSTRLGLFASITFISCFCIACFNATLARAQDVAPAEVENSKYQFAGVVNSNAVFVRSGPSENDYATMKLDKGAEVKVVGIRFEWLKVVPPEGSFCYVAKAFIDRRGAGNVGRVQQTLNVRVGSQLNELKAKIASKLEPGTDVEILGEEQEYFKIKPPAGVFFYINKQYVDPERPIKVDATGNEVAPQAGDTPVPAPAVVDAQASAAIGAGTATGAAADGVGRNRQRHGAAFDAARQCRRRFDCRIARHATRDRQRRSGIRPARK